MLISETLEKLLPCMKKDILEKYPDAEIVLEEYYDPEFSDNYLQFTVRKNEYELDFLEQLNKINEKYNEQLSNEQYFLITTDFGVKPKVLSMQEWEEIGEVLQPPQSW